MLTNEYLKDHFIDAYFIDNERENIEILATSEDKKQVFSTIIPFNEEHSEYKALMTIMSLDELHENTYKHKKEEKRLFDEHVINIAKKDGLVFDEYKLDTKFYPTLVSAILKDQKDEDHLFALKLALFENETISGSDNAELKAEIRKGKSKIEVLQAALKLFSEK
jgi:hypothetical protein|tara:strand:+ start:335 stop:829 length:495 start_codon:yes stop_codon:yes gene_type:complete